MKQRLLALLFGIALGVSPASAQDGLVFTADLPFDASQSIPRWMHGAPVSVPSTSDARVAFHLSPPTGYDLLVQLVFQDVNEAGLRVEWLRDGQSSPELISANLGEGLGLLNQRPLLISASRLGGNGKLLLQGDPGVSIKRIKFEWVSERTILSSSARYVPVVVTASRLALAEADVDGGTRPLPKDEWRERVVRATLTEKTELLTPSLEMLATLEQAPLLARLETSLAGVYLDQEVWLIVNGQEVCPIAIEVPTLGDPGHLGIAGREVEFAGWRKASAHIPAELLLPGENSILLELRSPVNSDYRNKAHLREALLELSYPPTPPEPDLSMPLRDLPVSESLDSDEPLPPVETTPAPPGDLLKDYWSREGLL